MPSTRHTRLDINPNSGILKTRGSMVVRNTRSKQPLQDITDQFVFPVSDSRLNDGTAESPTRVRPKPKRSAKIPGAPLSSRQKANIPSSLPPSSPPSSSSRLQASGPTPGYARNDESMLYHRPATDDSDQLDFEFALPQLEQDFGEPDENVNSLNMSDPFGFLAVEKMLKAQRAQVSHHGTTGAHYRASPPPPIATTLEVEGAMREIFVTPLIPHKRVGKRKALASPGQSSAGILSSSSIPSTPSPFKLPLSVGNAKAVHDDDLASDEGGLQDDTEKEQDASRGMFKKRSKVKMRKAKIPRGSRSPVNPKFLASSLESLLPKRPARRAAARRAKKKTAKETEDVGDDEVIAKERKGNGSKVQRKASVKGKSKGKPQGGGKAKDEGEVIDLDDDERKKWERERQQRLEYFRKLEDYQVEKENVYVI